MPDNGIIKISASLDAESFKAIISAIREVTREANQAAEALNRMGAGMRGGSMGVSGTSSQSTPAASQAASSPGQVQLGGLAGGIFGGMQNAAGMIRGAIDTTVNAAKAVGSAMGEMASASDSRIGHMITSFQKLTSEIKSATDATRGFGGGSGGGYNASQGPRWELPGESGPAYDSSKGPRWKHAEDTTPTYNSSHGPKWQTAEGPATYDSSQGPKWETASGLKQSIWQRFGGSPMGQFVGSFLPPGATAAMSRMAPILGPAAGLAGAAYLGFKAYEGITDARARVNVSNMDEAANYQPWYQGEMQATAGRVYGGAAVSVLGGDLARIRAMKLLKDDKGYQAAMSPEVREKQFALLAHDLKMNSYTSPIDQKSHTSASGDTVTNLKASVKGNVDTIFSKIGDLFGDAMDARTKSIARVQSVTSRVDDGSWKTGQWVPPAGLEATPAEREAREKVQSIEWRQKSAALQQRQMQDQERAVQNKIAADPMYQFMSSQIMGSAFGDMSMYRSAGWGQREVYDKNKEFVGYSGDLRKKAFEMAGFSGGEGAALAAALGRAGGVGLRGMAGAGLLSMQAGGLYNTVDLFGSGAQMGGYRGGGTPEFLKAVQSTIGRGGIDVTAGADLSSIVSQMALTAHADTGADLAWKSIAGSMYLPSVGGENMAGRDVRAARNAAGGLKYESSLMSGKFAPVNQMVSWGAAMDAAGGNKLYAKALQQLSENPVEMRQILQGGKVSEALTGILEDKDRGSDPGAKWREMAQKFQGSQNTQHLVNTVRSLVGDTSEAGKFAGMVRAHVDDGGGTAAAFNDLLKTKISPKDFAEFNTLRGKGNLSSKEQKRFDTLRREALDKTHEALAGFAKVEHVFNGQLNDDETLAGLMMEIGMPAPKGGGSWSGIGKKAPQMKAAGFTGTQTGQKSVAAKDWLEKTGAPSDLKDYVASLEESRKGIQGANATDFAAVQKTMAEATNNVSEALNMLAHRIRDAAQGKTVETSSGPSKPPVRTSGGGQRGGK